MNVEIWLSSIQQAAERKPYILRYAILDWSQSILKVRLYVTQDLFVQVYRNDQFDSTSLTLIHNKQRLYARDQIEGQWHRHPLASPEQHDKSKEGQRNVTLDEFLDEIEGILAGLGLP